MDISVLNVWYCLFSGSLILYGSFLIYLSERSKAESKHQQNWTFKDESPTVSVLIAARNEEKNLGRILDQLSNQNYPIEKLQVLIINDHSEDKTRKVFEEWITDHPQFPAMLSELSKDEKGKKAALRLGQTSATGDFHLYTDADCDLPFHWISDMVICQQNAEADMVCGAVVMKADSIAEHAEALEFSSLIATAAGSLMLGVPSLCNAANYLVSAKTLDEANRQRKDGNLASGDDVFLLHRLYKMGKKLAYCRLPLAFVEIEPQPDLTSFIDQRIRWAGKWKSGIAGSNSAMAMGVWFFHLLYLTGILVLAMHHHSNWILIAIGWKSISETFFLEPFLRKPGFSENSGRIWLAQIPYSIYVILFGIRILFSGKYSWKGREILS